jgi:hypothetical protein
MKGQRLNVSSCSSTFACAFVVPFLPQPHSREQVRKLMAEVSCFTLALD